jgi:2-methylisocitrate lyase-like PEP mutase family enzyme
MSEARQARARIFHSLHAPGLLLVLANAWDAASARMIEGCGARAIATTSAGLAWSHGYPDGDALPPDVLAAAVAEIARVISVPLSVDFEGGYAADPARVGEGIARVIDAGAVGINLEDGTDSPDILCAKIEAVKTAARGRGVDLFVNARCDVFLRRLAAPERALAETLARGGRYRSAGADGLFVPGVTDTAAIRAIAAGVALPLNVIVMPGLPPVAELAALGVRRLSAGSRIHQAAYRTAREAATALLRDGRIDALVAPGGLTNAELNALFAARS